MPQFVVPQFIDVEDKIIGPITTRQFIMGVIVLLFLFLAYRFADTALFALEAIFLFGFYVLMAFVKVNGRPFYYFILNMIRSFKRPSLRLWSREATNWHTVPAGDIINAPAAPALMRKKLVDQELSALSLLVDTGGRYRPEEILQKQKQNKNNGKV
ncbi:MAG: PrgI family protein [Patescibacteria group bacterium]